MPNLGLGLTINKQQTIQPLIVPSALDENAIAIYSARPTGISDYAVMISSDFTTAEMDAIFGSGNHPTAGEIAAMKTYHGADTWVGLEPVVINPDNKYYWPDRSGNKRHLHFVNMAYDATGGLQIGPPANYLCDGVNDYAVYNSVADIVAANGAFSLFVVFNSKMAPGFAQSIVRLGLTDVIHSYIDLEPTAFDASIYDTGIVSKSQCYLATTPVINTWYSACLVYDSATKRASLSINGGAFTTGGVIANGTKAMNRIVLSAKTDFSAPKNNRISELILLNKTVSLAEVKILHNNIALRYGMTKA